MLADLLGDTSLGLRLLTGREALDRPVRGVYITDLPDPRRYLSGGELVLSGLVWHGGAQDSDGFAAALADAGVAGLACGTARLGKTPRDLVRACAAHGIPAFEVPLSVSFSTLADRVQRPVPRHDLVAAVAAGASPDRVLALAAERLAADCWIVSAAGWTVAGTAELTAAEHRAVRDAAAGRLPRRVSGDLAVWPVDAGPGPRASRWLVVIRGTSDAAEHEGVAGELGTVAALVRARVDEARRIAGRSAEAAMRGLLDGTSSGTDAVARLEAAGLPPGEPLRVVALRSGAAGESAALLAELAAASGLAAVTAPLGDAAAALFADDRDHLLRLEDRLRALAADAGSADEPVAAGISDITGIGGLRAALEEAVHARRLAERAPGAVRIAGAAELATHDVLLASVPAELRRSYRDRLLAELLAYDAAHGSDLTGTLRAFLESSGSWTQCAQRLHLHVNTLRYRIRRVEELTGRDLGHFPTRVDFFLALRAEAPGGPEPISERA
nr:PucR family transcriptional regulator [Saccharopolyspora sp. HNM0983]